jgi:transcriptional regulator with XRE-family HTH domain
MLIGERLKSLRKSKKMSLTQLSNQSGVQLATLSRIENMKMVGTLESHIQISKALGIDVTELYRNPGESKASLVEFDRDSPHNDVFTHSEHSSYEILTRNLLQKKMMPVLIRIDAGGKTSVEQNNAGAEKFIFVLEGSIEAHINKETLSLHKGNTMYFDASLPHSLHNIGKTTAKLLCVTTPVSL